MERSLSLYCRSGYQTLEFAKLANRGKNLVTTATLTSSFRIENAYRPEGS